MHVKVRITLFLRDKNMHTNEVSRTVKLTSFARLFLLFLSLQSYRTTGSIHVFREERYFSCKAFKVLGRENLASRRNRVIFQECLYKKHLLLVSESFAFHDIWRPKFSQWLEKCGNKWNFIMEKIEQTIKIV